MKLIIDDRERSIIPRIGDGHHPHEIVIERLTVGDYAFVLDHYQHPSILAAKPNFVQRFATPLIIRRRMISRH